MEGQIYNLSKEFKIAPEEIERIINSDVDVTEEIMGKLNKYYIEEWSKLERDGLILKDFNKDYVDQKTTAEAWKNNTLNKQLMGEAIAMQEGATIIGGKLAKEKGNPTYKVF